MYTYITMIYMFLILTSRQTFSLLHTSSCVEMLQTMAGQRQIHLFRSWPKNCKNVNRNCKSWRPQGPMRRRQLLISKWNLWKYIYLKETQRNQFQAVKSMHGRWCLFSHPAFFFSGTACTLCTHSTFNPLCSSLPSTSAAAVHSTDVSLLSALLLSHGNAAFSNGKLMEMFKI